MFVTSNMAANVCKKNNKNLLMKAIFKFDRSVRRILLQLSSFFNLFQQEVEILQKDFHTLIRLC